MQEPVSINAKVIERSSGNTLFECPMNQLDEAYAYAVRMEEMDIEVDIRTPGLTESLAMELGSNGEDLGRLHDELEHELQDHGDDSCCHTNPQK